MGYDISSFHVIIETPKKAGHKKVVKLDPVDSTVCYEMMNMCTGSVKDTMRR